VATSALALVVLAAPGVSSTAVTRVVAVQPFGSTARPAPAGALPLLLDQDLLDAELQLLEDELADLRLELLRTDNLDAFESPLLRIQDQIDGLRARRAQLDALFARVLGAATDHPTHRTTQH
jgi:hypothetical protein